MAAMDVELPQDDRVADTREPVHILPYTPREMVWPHPGPVGILMYVGAVSTPIMLTMTLGGVNAVLLWVGVALSAAVVGGAIVLVLRRLWLRMTKTPRSGPAPPSSARLKVMAPLDTFVEAVETAPDTAFEPVVFRLQLPAAFGETAPTGEFVEKPGDRGKKRRHAAAQLIRDRSMIVADVLVGVLAVGAVAVLHRLSHGSWHRGGSPTTVWSAVAIMAVLSALVKPSYLRIAPGVLDVFIYGPLGFGPPRVERFDLRRAKVLVDEKAGWIGITDEARTERRVLFLRRRSAFTLESLAVWTLRAARSKHPAPPLPLDALSG